MANPHPTEPYNQRMDKLADQIDSAVNDIIDWLYDREHTSLHHYVTKAEQIVMWAEKLRDEAQRWQETGKPAE